jgi:hypothetical protein
VETLDAEIDGLRGLIRELRPAALDELGAAGGHEGLGARVGQRNGLDVEANVRLPDARYAPELDLVPRRMAMLGLIGGPSAFASATAVPLGAFEQTSGAALIVTQGRGALVDGGCREKDPCDRAVAVHVRFDRLSRGRCPLSP